MNSDWDDQLRNIQILRKEAYKLDLKIIIALFFGVLLSAINPMLAWIGGILAFSLFYRKIVKSAHFPCPKCCEPFGVKQKWPLGLGGNACQNCGLGLTVNE